MRNTEITGRQTVKIIKPVRMEDIMSTFSTKDNIMNEYMQKKGLYEHLSVSVLQITEGLMRKHGIKYATAEMPMSCRPIISNQRREQSFRENPQKGRQI